tara:strand:+ start:116 stop:490 length:375 start_codon:yes stop_codon:yes gene_type:complete
MTDSYNTPTSIMRMFEDWFDPCPLNDNPNFDGLSIDWKDKTFVNPPYSKPMPWVEKAIEESKKGKRIVMLLKMDTSTRWYAKIHEHAKHILYFSKRLSFKRYGQIETTKLYTYTAAFPSVLVFL